MRHVGDGGIHRPCRPHTTAFIVRLCIAFGGPAIGQVAGEIRAPRHAAVRHAEAIEHALLHQRTHILAQSPTFDHELQQDQALAGIAVAAAGLEVELQPAIRFEKAEVGEAAGVVQQPSRRELAPTRITRQDAVVGVLLRFRWIVRQWFVQGGSDAGIQIDTRVLRQLCDQVAEGHLGERCGVHHGVGAQWLACGVAFTVGSHMHHLAVIDHRQRHPARMGCLHQPLRFGIDASGRGHGWRRGQYRQREQRQQHQGGTAHAWNSWWGAR